MLDYMTPERCRQNYDWVCWLDADLVIGDYDTPLTKWTNTRGADSGEEMVYGGDFILPWDVNTYHPTVMNGALHDADARDHVGDDGSGQRLYHLHDWSEHMALKFFSYPPYRDAIHQHSAKVLCAMPPGVHPMPDDVRALYEYEEGVSFALHLSAISIERRIELARAFIAEHPIPWLLSLLPHTMRRTNVSLTSHARRGRTFAVSTTTVSTTSLRSPKMRRTLARRAFSGTFTQPENTARRTCIAGRIPTRCA